MNDDEVALVATHLSTIIGQQATLIAELKLLCKKQAKILDQVNTENNIKERMAKADDITKDNPKHK